MLFETKKNLFRTHIVIAIMMTIANASAREWQDKWVFVSKSFSSDDAVIYINNRIFDAKAKGFNGIALGTGCAVENVDIWDATRLTRLRQVKAAADAAGLEIIPVIWSVGRGSMIGRDPNLAAALPVKDEPFVVSGGVAVRETEANLTNFTNGGFENPSGITDWTVAPDKPITFADTSVSAEGSTSVKLTPTSANKNARISKIVTLKPNRNYRLSCLFKTLNFNKPKQIGLQIRRKLSSNPQICQTYFTDSDNVVSETSDWVRRTITFNPGEDTQVGIYAGAWDVTSGTLWIDDVRLEPNTPLTNVVRRAGTPFTVKSATNPSLVYTENSDYKVISANGVSRIEIVSGGRIRNGDRLQVSYYHRALSDNNQASLCMSNPALYEHFQTSAAAIARELAPRKWLLSMDEIHSGGTCLTCRERNTDMAHILGDCVTRQCGVIKSVAPNARIYIWSDMFYPDHNAVNDYRNCRGAFVDSWKYIPKDITLACWSNGKTGAIPFFDQLGFHTLAAAYYDSNITTCKAWLEVCQSATYSTGLMYTTWKGYYSLLDEFGKLIADSAPDRGMIFIFQ